MMINYHVVDVLVGADFLFEGFVQSADDQVAVVFVFHQLADAIDFQPTDALTFQHLAHSLSIIVKVIIFNKINYKKTIISTYFSGIETNLT